MKKEYYEIGLLIRGKFRRWCMQLSLTYKEDKGWLDSGFLVEGDENKIAQLNQILEEIKTDTEKVKNAEV